MLLDEGKIAEAESTSHEALAMLEKRFGADQFPTAKAHQILAGILHAKRQPADAETAYRRVLSIQLERLSNSPLFFDDEYADLGITLASLTSLLREQGQSAAAETLQRETLDKVRAVVGSDQPLVAEILGQSSASLVADGKFADAESLARESLQLDEKLLPGAWQTFCAMSAR